MSWRFSLPSATSMSRQALNSRASCCMERAAACEPQISLIAPPLLGRLCGTVQRFTKANRSPHCGASGARCHHRERKTRPMGGHRERALRQECVRSYRLPAKPCAGPRPTHAIHGPCVNEVACGFTAHAFDSWFTCYHNALFIADPSAVIRTSIYTYTKRGMRSGGDRASSPTRYRRRCLCW